MIWIYPNVHCEYSVNTLQWSRGCKATTTMRIMLMQSTMTVSTLRLWSLNSKCDLPLTIRWLPSEHWDSHTAIATRPGRIRLNLQFRKVEALIPCWLFGLCLFTAGKHQIVAFPTIDDKVLSSPPSTSSLTANCICSFFLYERLQDNWIYTR